MQHLHGAFMYKTQGQWGHKETQLHKCCAYYMHIYINKLGLLINKSILVVHISKTVLKIKTIYIYMYTRENKYIQYIYIYTQKFVVKWVLYTDYIYIYIHVNQTCLTQVASLNCSAGDTRLFIQRF